MTPHRALEYPILPVLRADNAEVLLHPDDRKYGALLIGSMGSGKTAALLRMVLNDIRDENAAPIIIDPKSELSHLCLRLIPPECGKRVWFLDLGRPAFGMSPLRRPGEGPLAIEAAALAENVVAALSDISENQAEFVPVRPGAGTPCNRAPKRARRQGRVDRPRSRAHDRRHRRRARRLGDPPTRIIAAGRPG